MGTSPADEIASPFSMQIPRNIRLIDELDTGDKPECQFLVPDCLRESASLLHQDSGDLELCGGGGGSHLGIRGFYVTMISLGDEDDGGSLDEEWSDCGNTEYEFGPRLLEGRRNHHKIERKLDWQGQCTVQFSEVQPRVWDGTKRHFYAFGRFGRDYEGRTWLVSVVFETREKSWGLAKDLLQRSAQSFEVDWDKFSAAYARTTKEASGRKPPKHP